MRQLFKDQPEIVFLGGFAGFCLLYYMANWVAFAAFIGSLIGVSLDPIVIFAAIVSAFIGRKYSTFIGISFGIGFAVAIIQSTSSTRHMAEIGFGGRSGIDNILMLAYVVSVPLLANSINLIRSWFPRPATPPEELKPEDTEYFVNNYIDNK